jgi:hypothetical protein
MLLGVDLFGNEIKCAQRTKPYGLPHSRCPVSLYRSDDTSYTALAKLKKSNRNITPKNLHFQEFISITPTFSSFYNIPDRKVSSNKKIHKTKPIIRVNNRPIRRLQKAVNYLMITSPRQTTYCKEMKRHINFKLNFITLTLSQKQFHTDEYIKSNMLDRFLKWIVYKGATGYVWKAETQKNGNIHFHITANKYIHWRDIRSYWNGLQERHGYTANYFNAHGSTDANSTDVHAIKNEQKALKYISKYIIKSDSTRRVVSGHSFGYSRNLANIKINLPTSDIDTRDIIDYLKSMHGVTKRFDYVTLLYHDLISLDKCPKGLADLINEATKKKERVR